MKKAAIILTTVLFAVTVLFPANCFPQKKKAGDAAKIKNPVVIYAEWPGNDEASLYKNCLASLHMANIDIDAIKSGNSKDLGLIITDSVKYRIPPDFTAVYRLSIKVFRLNDSKSAIHIIVNHPKIRIKSMYVGKDTLLDFNNIIAEDINKFMVQLEALQGKASFTNTTTLEIDHDGI